MRLLIQFIAILLMLFGLVVILLPKFHGAVITLLGCILYTLNRGLNEGSQGLLLGLASIAVMIEISGIAVAPFLAKRYNVSTKLSADAVAGNIAGLVVTDALFGLLGIVAFETIITKTLMPRLNTMGKVFIRLAVGAVLRVICGIVMVLLVLIYA